MSAENDQALAETLLLLDRVIAAAVTSIVVTDPHLPDNPIVYHNPAFERVTGYEADEIDGHNCRFLQGEDTDPAAVEEIRAALREERPCHIVLRNYKKDGTPFWNELSLSPIHDADGRLTHFVGVQTDVTRRQEAERERDVLLARQQQIADTLQRALLLAPPDSFPGLEVATQYEPAREEAQVGGDFYDAFALTEDRVALVVGDITGKGLRAAQHTAEMKYALRVLLREHANPVPALERLNAFLLGSQRLDGREADTLLCVALVLLDTRTGEAVVTAAGMEPPLVVRTGGMTEEVRAGGLMIGIDPAARYREAAVALEPGDTLILHTDGVTEARDARREFFGLERLERAARKAARRGPREMGEEIVTRVHAFAGGRSQDDLCLLLARRAV